jgi:hypothetical protein
MLPRAGIRSPFALTNREATYRPKLTAQVIAGGRSSAPTRVPTGRAILRLRCRGKATTAPVTAAAPAHRRVGGSEARAASDGSRSRSREGTARYFLSCGEGRKNGSVGGWGRRSRNYWSDHRLSVEIKKARSRRGPVRHQRRRRCPARDSHGAAAPGEKFETAPLAGHSDDELRIAGRDKRKLSRLGFDLADAHK